MIGTARSATMRSSATLESARCTGMNRVSFHTRTASPPIDGGEHLIEELANVDVLDGGSEAARAAERRGDQPPALRLHERERRLHRPRRARIGPQSPPPIESAFPTAAPCGRARRAARAETRILSSQVAARRGGGEPQDLGEADARVGARLCPAPPCSPRCPERGLLLRVLSR